MKKTKLNGLFGGAMLSLLFAASPAMADDHEASEGNWRFSAYLWTMGLEGDLGIGPIQEEVDLSFSDLLSALDIGGAHRWKTSQLPDWWRRWPGFPYMQAPYARPGSAAG